MADERDYAFKGLDVLGGIGGAILGIFGGEAGAKGAQSGIGAVKDIVTMAGGGPQAPVQTPQAAPQAPQPAPDRGPTQPDARSRVRRFDAPMFERAGGRGVADKDTAEDSAGADPGAPISMVPDSVTSQQSLTYVTAFASRLVLSLAYALSEVGPAERWDDNFDDTWIMALFLVGWYADRLPAQKQQAVAIALQPLRGLYDVPPLGLFGRRKLRPFISAAEAARDERELEAAGSSLAASIQQIGVSVFFDALHTIAGPIKQGDDSEKGEARKRAQQRIPYPPPLRAHYYEILGRELPKNIAPNTLHPHAERAGYAPHTDDYDHDSVMSAGIGDITEKLS